MITKNQIADILQFIADTLRDEQPGTLASAIPSETSAAPAAPRRGRKPKETPPEANANNAPQYTQDPATQQQASSPAPVVTEETKAAEPEPEAPKTPPIKGKTLDELRALIDPLVKAARGIEVKKVLNKYAPADHAGDYTLSLLADHPEHHAAFEKDIETLSL